MANDILNALKAILAVHGNLKRPIPPGVAFVTFPSEEEFRSIEVLADQPYPPIITDNPCCVFDLAERTLSATVWGRAVFSRDGIRVKPCWRMSKDKVYLTVDVSHEDFLGQPVTLERIQSYMPKFLEGAGVSMSLDEVSSALETSAKTGKEITVTIAQGRLPEEGSDAYLELAFNTRHTAGVLREDGSMDFRERADLLSIAEGELLGKLHPAETGAPGVDLFGNEIKPTEVKQLKIGAGQGVNTSVTEDGIFLYTAARTGLARFRDGTIEVADLLEIPGDVDFSTGNIHAKQGSIYIKGDVKSGFIVESSGDVIIDGVVEEADIFAGGLVIAGGVIMNGGNRIVAKGDVSAHFFRNAIIEAGGNVTADLEISHCNVTAAGKVSVVGGKGIISGGHIISGDDILASIIGNKACSETLVEIRLPSSKGDMLNAAKEQLEDELEKLSRAIGVDFTPAQLLSAPEEDRRILAELIKVRARILADIRDIDETNKAILEAAQQLTASKRIKASQKAYCGIEVMICGKAHSVKSDMDSPSFFLDAASRQIAWE